MIWFDVKREVTGITLEAVVNADYVVSISPAYRRTKSTIRTSDDQVWTSDTPYDDLRLLLRDLKNKGIK